MNNKTVEILGSINIQCANDLETGKDRLLVCLDDPNERKRYLFLDELFINDVKYIAYNTKKQ